MAAYTISYTSTTVTFSVTGLTAGDIVVFYVRTEPSSGSMLVDDTTSYKATGSTMTQSFTVALVAGGRYAVNVGVNYVNIGIQYFTAPATSGRPTNWSWSGIIYSGAPLENLTAAVWNQFTSRVNEFRRYKGQANYSFTTAVSGVTDISVGAAEAMAAIRGLTGHGTLPSAVTIEASTWIQLAAALNAVS